MEKLSFTQYGIIRNLSLELGTAITVLHRSTSTLTGGLDLKTQKLLSELNSSC